MAKTSFTKRLQNTPKIRAIRRKIKENKLKGRALSRKYQSLIKSESKRLSKKY